MLKKITKVVLLYSLFMIFLNMNAEEKMVIRIKNSSEKLKNLLTSNKYDIAGRYPGRYWDVVVTEKEKEFFISQGYEVEVTQTEAQLKQNLTKSKDLEGYRDYETTLFELFQLQDSYPNLCKLIDIGDSQGKLYYESGIDYYEDYNHEIWALKVSDNVEDDEDEPAVYFMAEHHAREPISLEVVMEILYNLINNYESDDSITEIINNTELWFIPLVNPNGHKIVTDQTDVWWRKNIRDNNNNHVFDFDQGGNGYDGVDPNRNYGFQWGNVGASDDYNSATYHGPEPFSEPEIQAIRDLMEEKHFIAGLSYHSSGELVLYPFGYAEGVISPDFDALSTLGIQMAESITSLSGGHYSPFASYDLYACMGTTDDYAYGVHGTFAYTIELAQDFIPTPQFVPEICENNVPASIILLERLNHSILTGHIYESETRTPLEAEVYIHEVDATGEFKYPYKSEENFGRYYRILQDGVYTATFSAYGYESVTIEDIFITPVEQTAIDVMLSPVENTDISGLIYDINTGNPIENAEIQMINTPIESVFTNMDGEFNFNEVCYGDFELFISAENYTAIQVPVSITEFSTSFSYAMHSTNPISFEDALLPDNWESYGNTGFVIDNNDAFDGAVSLKSGNHSHGSESFLSFELDVTEHSEISFYKKVSSEAGWDILSFSIDNILVGQWSGERDWSEFSCLVEEGTHTFEWSYSKDSNTSDGQDCGWIDLVSLPICDNVTFFPPQNFDVEHTVSENQDHYNLTWDEPQTSAATLIGYNIYIDNEISCTIEPNVFECINPVGNASDDGAMHFYITALYSDPIGESLPSNEVIIQPTNNDDLNNQLEVTQLKNCYPNPFSISKTRSNLILNYTIAEKNTNVDIALFNLKGQKVKQLVKSNVPKGEHQINWNFTDNNNNKISSGIYFYRMKTDEFTSTKKLLLVK